MDEALLTISPGSLGLMHVMKMLTILKSHGIFGSNFAN